MSREQQARAGRLLAILKAAFSGHGRAETIIRAFGEGITLGGMGGTAFNDNGFGLLRVLTKEFALQSRAEALALRSELLQKQFTPSKSDTSTGTVVADTIRKLETHLAKFNKLISTLPTVVDRVGIEISEADQLLMLLRSLPQACAEYVLLHSSQETYAMARATACRYESQRRLYLDWNSLGKPGKMIHQVGKPETYDMSVGDGEELPGDDVWVEAVNGRCDKCGSKRHNTAGCSVDLSKTRCFKCGGLGHVSMNCPKTATTHSTQKGGQKGAGGASTSSGSGRQKIKEKGKENPKAKVKVRTARCLK